MYELSKAQNLSTDSLGKIDQEQNYSLNSLVRLSEIESCIFKLRNTLSKKQKFEYIRVQKQDICEQGRNMRTIL